MTDRQKKSHIKKAMKAANAPAHLVAMALILLEHAEGDGWQAARAMVEYSTREVTPREFTPRQMPLPLFANGGEG